MTRIPMTGRHARTAFCLPALLVLLILPCAALGQASDDYLLGEQNRLEIIVHVLGEVQRPGEYRVSDNTNVLELLSKAGGGTSFANMSAVTITRRNPEQLASNSDVDFFTKPSRRIIRIDIHRYLNAEDSAPLPILHPGDIISVPRNGLSKWKTGFSITKDLLVIASAYFLYMRSTK